jgi:2-polyprenyl-3-methyl-5-hydroxy-6-metoxy-1,4-benzoquinol methylase
MAASRFRNEARRARAALRRRAKGALLARAGANGAGPNASAAVVGDDQLWVLDELYRDYALEPIGFGSVRDFADSVDNMPGLAAANADMKNLQRCWAVKAILGNVERGGHLVEIGAGEPLVAGLLTRLGYRVTIVDPYDGSGNGPREYAEFVKAYPDVEIVRDQFPPQAGLSGKVDCVYSISVLEHVPLEAIDGVISASRELLRPTGGCSIHAIDHVLAGWGSDSHRAGLDRIIAGLDLDADELTHVVDDMERNPETYLVSAESHNQWRGALAYDDYPMRRIASVQVLKRES